MQTIVHRSPVILAFKIIFLEVLIELMYLLIGVLVTFIGTFMDLQLDLISPLTQLLLLPLQIGVLVFMLIRWSGDLIEIRDKELIIKKGVFKRTEQAYPYNNMQSVTVRQSLLERLVGAGTISVFVPTLGKDLVFSEIPDPHRFAENIKTAMPYPEKTQFLVRR